MQTGREFAKASGGGVVASLLGAIICVTTTGALAEGPLKFPSSQLNPIKWSELAGWTADDHLAALAAYQTSCQALLKIRRTDERGELSVALSNVCRKAASLPPQDTETARAFFEQNFQPVRIGRLGEAEGLLTGYFEPIVAGSRFPSPEFHVPVYRRPRDLVAVGYKPASIAFPNKGVRIGRRTANDKLMPYHDRGAIEAGALEWQKLEICWLKDPFDLLTIQMEGSARVILEDGTPLRISYDSHNGYPQRIRDWMAAHPDEAAKVRAANRSYVFFRVTGLTNESEPVGAQGVPLTPGRSIAIDRVHEYGTPFFIEAELPIEGSKPASPFRRLMIAQDTGSAIVGPARADLYWGAGDEAGRIARRIRHPGRFVMLLPRELDIAVAGREPPFPKPKIAALEVGKQDGKGKVESVGTGAAGGEMPSPLRKPSIVALEVKKHDDKGKANSANAGASATGHQKPPPLSNTKITVLEVGKQNGKGKANSANAGASATGKSILLPVLRPKNLATEGKKQEGKVKVETVGASSSAIAAVLHRPSLAPKSKTAGTEGKKQEGKVKVETVGANSSAIAAGLHKPLLAPKSKTDEIEVKKQNGKGKTDSASAGETAAGGKQKLSLAPTSKIARSKVDKPDGKRRAEAVNAGEIAASGNQKPSLAAKSKIQDAKGKAQAANAGEEGRAAAKSRRQAAPRERATGP